MDWDKLRIFHAVAAAGSFTHAGETLDLRIDCCMIEKASAGGTYFDGIFGGDWDGGTPPR